MQRGIGVPPIFLSGASGVVYPCAMQYSGRLGGPFVVYAESAQAREEWKEKLGEALQQRKAIQESRKVFEVETLIADTHFAAPAGNLGRMFTGQATCSVPFSALYTHLGALSWC